MKSIAIETFQALASKARAACESRSSTHQFEAEFADVLRHIENHPEARRDFGQLFVAMLWDTTLGPWELICYCMHQLRWDEVRLAALKEIALNEDYRVKSVMSSVVDSFSDAWRDADLYERFTPRG